MLEECRLPYTLIPVNISKGEQFKPDFLKISPNNRMPAIVDPDGPGRPADLDLRVGRHPAISRPQDRQVLSDATSAAASRSTNGCSGRWAASGRWRGRCITSRTMRVETLTYAIDRYVNEVNRLYGVMNMRLTDREFIAGKYSIADMALVGWVNGWKRQGQDIDEFPHLKRWLETGEGAPRRAARHGARPRTAPGHRHEGSEGAGGAVRAARARRADVARQRFVNRRVSRARSIRARPGVALHST